MEKVYEIMLRNFEAKTGIFYTVLKAQCHLLSDVILSA